MNTYVKDFDKTMQAGVWSKQGNGAFIHSCHTHCEAQSPAWNHFAVNGVTMQQAVSAWWKSSGEDAAASHSYSPCLYRLHSKPHACNPSCGVKMAAHENALLV